VDADLTPDALGIWRTEKVVKLLQISHVAPQGVRRSIAFIHQKLFEILDVISQRRRFRHACFDTSPSGLEHSFAIVRHARSHRNGRCPARLKTLWANDFGQNHDDFELSPD
jgi:hypothetical protein